MTVHRRSLQLPYLDTMAAAAAMKASLASTPPFTRMSDIIAGGVVGDKAIEAWVGQSEAWHDFYFANLKRTIDALIEVEETKVTIRGEALIGRDEALKAMESKLVEAKEEIKQEGARVEQRARDAKVVLDGLSQEASKVKARLQAEMLEELERMPKEGIESYIEGIKSDLRDLAESLKEEVQKAWNRP